MVLSDLQAAITKPQMILWIANILNRPPFPVSPRESIFHGVEPKAPAFYEGRYYKPLKWKQYQHWETLEKSIKERLIKKWHADQRIEGVSTLGGWNGRHWLCWIDVDAKSQCWESETDPQACCEQAVAEHLNKYLVLKDCPRFRSPSRGYRFLIAFDQEPENFKANSGFSFSPGAPRVGELLTKQGGHTLLPPAVGTNGKPYYWEFFREYPPVVARPEDVGLFLVEGKSARQKPSVSPQPRTEADERRKAFLYAFILNDCLPRLSWEQIYAGDVGNFQPAGDEVKGSCPLPGRTHPNETGTAFSVNMKDNTWYCFGCSVGGSPIQFVDRMLGGDGRYQTVKRLEHLAEEFARRAKVALPELWWKQEKRSRQSDQRSSLPGTKVEKNSQLPQPRTNIEQLKQQILSFLNTAPSTLELTIKIIEWSDEFAISPSLIKTLVQAVGDNL